MKKELTAINSINILLHKRGVHTWDQLINHIRNIPYGRNANRSDFNLVLTEKKGTCSSKHALVKQIADANNIPSVKLILGMYKMTTHNTPGIGNHLADNGLAYMPEAHCYLKINDRRIDLTNAQSDIARIANDIIIEETIEPDQVATYKVNYHKAFMKNWLVSEGVELDVDTIWSFREQCISSLSASNA